MFLGKNVNRAMRRVAGFSMIELLVAVLVMGIGVLGVTGLQMVSLQNNRDALLRSEAIQLAYDILDKIRVNPGVPAGAGVLGQNYDGVDIGDVPVAPTDCVANQCNAGQMAGFDIALWKCSLGAFNENNVCSDLRDDTLIPAVDDRPGLPNGDGSIEVGAGGVITVTVQWNGFNNVAQTIAIESQG